MLSGWKLLETHLIYCHVARYIKEFTQGSGLFTSFLRCFKPVIHNLFLKLLDLSKELSTPPEYYIHMILLQNDLCCFIFYAFILIMNTVLLV